ncbi:MAG: YigZ family protein [Bacteroidetes bacterium]|nr:YigZ family protein [Bacteroidota bacterium]
MLFSDSYHTIEKPVEGIFRDRGSKFIGFAYPVTKESEIKDIILKLKKEHTGANHHCYAYRLGADKQNYRANDDGEPAGTAGKPILGQIQSKDLTNILIVVVRYFAGTLLGVPGLINAYKNGAIEALYNATIIETHIMYFYKVSFSFERMNDIMRILKENSCKIVKQDFAEDCSIEFSVKKSGSEKLEQQLTKIFDIKYTFLNAN